MTAKKSAFWSDLENNLEDASFRESFDLELLKVRTIDDLINQLDSRREALGETKAELARRLNTQASAIRRFFSKPKINPTLASVVEISLALGYQIKLEELPKNKARQISKALAK